MSNEPQRLVLRRPSQEAASPAAPVHRVIRRTTPTQETPQVKSTPPAAPDHATAIKSALATLDGVDTQLALLATQRADLERQIHEHMEAGKLAGVTDGKYDVSVKDVKTRASREIDAKKFFDLLASRGEKEEAAAWDALKVGVTEAKKLLTTVELNHNFPEKPGATIGTTVVISRIAVKVGTSRA